MNSISTNRTAGTYWNHSGRYQKEYDELFKKLVPGTGSASTMEGEVLRAMSKLYYDYYNNGLGNIDVLDDEVAILKDSVRWVERVSGHKGGLSEFVKGLEEFVEASEESEYMEFDDYIPVEPEDYISEDTLENATDSVTEYVMMMEERKKELQQ